MRTAFSEQFEYDEVDYIVEFDASFNGSDAGIGWIVFTNPLEKPILEGTDSVLVSSSVEAEIEAMKRALKEVKKIKQESSIIVRTDFSGIIDTVKDDSKSEENKILTHLDSFKSWSVECVDRDKLVRAHDLANYSC